MTQNYWKFQSGIFTSPIAKLMDALLEAGSALDIILLEYEGRITISFQERKRGLMGCIRLLTLSVNNL
jgi:hypothetical protein